MFVPPTRLFSDSSLLLSASVPADDADVPSEPKLPRLIGVTPVPLPLLMPLLLMPLLLMPLLLMPLLLLLLLLLLLPPVGTLLLPPVCVLLLLPPVSMPLLLPPVCVLLLLLSESDICLTLLVVDELDVVGSVFSMEVNSSE